MNGQEYSGEWVGGKQHGPGVLRHKDGTVIHDGEWKVDHSVCIYSIYYTSIFEVLYS